MFGHVNLPEPGTEEAAALCRHWDWSTSAGKRELADSRELSYGGVANWRARCKRFQIPPTEAIRQDFSLEEHFRRMQAVDELILPHFRTPAEMSLRIETKLPIATVHSADWHMGEPGCDYDSLIRDIGVTCSEPGLYTVLGGDAQHNIIQPSKIGSSHNQQPISVQKSATALAAKRLHESGHLLFVGGGNHPYWSAQATGEDWDLELARRYHFVYTKAGAMIHIVAGEMDYPEFWEHKGKYSSTFNQTHGPKQSQRVYHPRARIVVREHQHIAAMEQYRYDDRECVAIRTGTYVTRSDFAEQNGLYGAHICNPAVVMFPDRDWLVGFKFMEDAIVYLRAIRADYEKRGLGKASEHVKVDNQSLAS